MVLSKLLDLHILDQCKNHELSAAQFGFIEGRGTGMATAMAHDVGSYCVTNGSPVFYTSLDAEGAFDFLPHSVIMQNCIGVLPDNIWFLVCNCYRNMCTRVRWDSTMSKNISIQRGTKQGGLCSPFIFNLFYYELIEKLQNAPCGVRIGDHHYNCFCYADDILLCSTTVTGLQKLINIATEYIGEHGLRFNPNKTTCMIMGGNPFTIMPTWSIQNVPLRIVDTIKYLGTDFGDLHGKEHINNRVKATNRAFFALQRSGVKYPDVSSKAVTDIFNVAIQTVLEYGCSCINLTKCNIAILNKLQGKLLKRCLNLYPRCLTQPILKAFSTPSTSCNIITSSFDLLKSCVLSSSMTKSFYCDILSKELSSCLQSKTLVSRVMKYSKENGIDILKYIFNSKYCLFVKKQIKDQYYVKNGTDGVIDTIRNLFDNHTKDNFRYVELLLTPF